MNTRAIYITIITLILITIGIWVSQKITITYEDARHPPSAEILKNSFSALEHVLIEQDIKVESLNSRDRLVDLPSPHDALFVRNIKRPLSEEQKIGLIDWIDQGGLLIYEPYWLGRSNEHTYFHQLLGVEILELEADEEYENPIHALSKINNETAYIHVNPHYHLVRSSNNTQFMTPEIILESEVGIHGFIVKIGNGSAIFLTDTRFLHTPEVWKTHNLNDNKPNNSGLSGHDHLYFIYSYLKDRKKVWFILDTSSPNLLTKIYQSFPFFTVLSTAWIILFFLYLLKRFGPVTYNKISSTSNFLKHIQQSGLYYWKLDKGLYLITIWRIRVLNKITLKHPHLSGLNNETLIMGIESTYQIPAESIRHALHATPTSSKEFIKIIRTLKQLWTIQ